MMFVRRFVFAVVLSVFLFVSGTGAVQAEPKMAVVDMQMLLNETKPAQSLLPQIKKKREALQAEFKGYDEELLKEEKALLEERKKDNPEDFKKKREAFEQKLLEARQKVQKEKRKLDEAIQKAREQLTTEIFKAIDKVANEKGYDLILRRRSVVVADKSYDISSDVKAHLEKALKKIDLKIKG